MSSKRLRWLLVIVITELLVIIGLVTWAATRPDTKEPGDNTATTTSEKGTLTTALLASGFGVVTDIASTPITGDDRLFIVERSGTIKVVDKSEGQTATLLLDLSAKVKDSGEMGLLGLTFHPEYAQNGYFYVNYVDKSDNTTISRFMVNAQGKVDPADEKILLTVKQPYPNHNAGGLAFGPDGFLYVTMGDGGSAGDPEARGQNKTELLGKILRINVNSGDKYSVPASNPFVDESGTKPEIWALGLRNPWRIAFDKATGDLYIADVGQGDLEEVNVQKATSKGGENYGWRCYEGTKTYDTAGCKEASAFTAPAFEYAHEEGRCSITGGYVYRGSGISSLEGSYIYGDYCTGEVFAAKQADSKWEQTLILKTPYMISTFGQGSNGELYMADTKAGAVYQLATH